MKRVIETDCWSLTRRNSLRPRILQGARVQGHLRTHNILAPSLPRVPKMKTPERYQVSFCKILKSKWYHAKVLPKWFRLNDHVIGFRPQIEKFELYYMSSQLSLRVKPSMDRYKNFLTDVYPHNLPALLWENFHIPNKLTMSRINLQCLVGS